MAPVLMQAYADAFVERLDVEAHMEADVVEQRFGSGPIRLVNVATFGCGVVS